MTQRVEMTPSLMEHRAQSVLAWVAGSSLKMSLLSPWGNALVEGKALDSTMTQAFERYWGISLKDDRVGESLLVVLTLHRRTV